MRRLLSFDGESNGLHGECFAVGAVVLDMESGRLLDQFELRAPTPNPCDAWVKAHVLPALATLPVTARSPRTMRESFWCWLRSHLGSAMPRELFVTADWAWPVEAGLLSACVRDAPGREFMGPTPLHEVATLLASAGFDPDKKYAPELLPEAVEHHPRWDAHVSALCARKAIQRLDYLHALAAAHEGP